VLFKALKVSPAWFLLYLAPFSRRQNKPGFYLWKHYYVVV